MAIIRPPHRLKPNKRSNYPKSIIFFDVETIPVRLDNNIIEHNLRLGVYCHYHAGGNKQRARETYRHFNTVSKFWDETLVLVHNKTRVLFISHHLDFDFLVLRGLSELERRGWYAENLIITGNTDIWKFVQYKYKPATPEWDRFVQHHKRRPDIVRSIVFIDLMNYFKMSLKALGSNIGIEKTEINFDTCTLEELRGYCENDVRIMVETWKKWTAFLHDHDMGVWGPTLSSQAFNAFRHRFMSHEIVIHSHQKALMLERDGYHGGRTEVFQKGLFTDGPYYLVDVNSMYPAMMWSRLFPIKLASYTDTPDMDDLHTYLDKYLMMADVLVDTRRNLFPYKYKGRLCFPLGRFWTCLSTPELREAYDLQEIVKLRRIAFYQGANIFKDYIDYFYNQRLAFKEAGDNAYAFITKLLMNSLYGKFGQKLEDYVPIATDPRYEIGFFSQWDADEQQWIRMRKIKGNVEVFVNHIESYNSFPAIAAHVTAYARVYLYHLFNNLPYGSFFYCDTDSLIVNQIGLEKLMSMISSVKLGSLSIQKCFTRLRINNVKDYEIDGVRKIKGVKSSAVQESYNLFKTWHQQSLKNVLWHENDDRCLWIRTYKALKQAYNKGIIYPGGEVLPFIFNES